MNRNSIKTVRDFLKYLQNEYLVSTGKKVFGEEIATTEYELISNLDVKNFIDHVTRNDTERLRLLKNDVKRFIQDEEFEAELKNSEIKRTSQDEFYLAEREFWKREYKKAIDKLSKIGKLRVQVLQQWIDEKKVSDDELDLSEQFNDDIVDAVATKQAFDRLIPAEGIFYPDTSKLHSFLRMVEYEIQRIESAKNEDPRAKLNENEDVKSKISRIAEQIDLDNRSQYEFEEVEMYLSVYKAYPELISCEKRKDHAMKFLSKNASIRLKKAKANTLSTSWQKKLDEIT